MSTRGIDIRQSSGQLIFRVSLKDANGDKVTTGTTELRVYRVEDDGTLDVYDWTTHAFVAPGSGTPDDETTMTHRQRRDSTGADVDTGIWTAVLSTLTNWTSGQVYIAQVTNSNAVPESQEREFQFGGVEGGQLGVTVEGRTANVTALGRLGINWGDIENPAALVNFSQTTINDLTTKAGFALSATGLNLISAWSVAIPDITTLLGRLTASRAGYLDNLNVGGLLASQADITGITQAQRVRIVGSPQLERPDAGSTAYRIFIYAYNEQHTAEDLDSNPTVTAENNAGVDRSDNLGAVTKVPATTGQYYVDYTVADSHAIEGIVLHVDATEGGVTTQYPAAFAVVDTTAVDFTSSDRTKLEAVFNKLPTALYLLGGANADGSGYSTHDAAGVWTYGTRELTGNNNLNDLDAAGVRAAVGLATANLDTQLSVLPTIDGKIDTVDANVDTLLSRITATLFAGITSLAGWLRLALRSDAAAATDHATELAEINADGGSGPGDFASTTDAQEAISDAGGGGGGGSTQIQAEFDTTFVKTGN